MAQVELGSPALGLEELDSAGLVEVFRQLALIRALDTKMIALQRQGAIGFYGAATGQEAVPVGVASALSDRDWVFPALRESTVLLLRGFPLERYLAQAFGTKDDVAKGRQMPSHMSGRAARVVSWSSAIGTQLPHAVGMAYAARLAGDPVIALAFLGDGATSVGDFHGALNLAGVWRVPCVFVCQNNQYALSTPAERQTASTSFAAKASAYGIPSQKVDGNDVLAVREATARARAVALEGRGPTFLECVTYRLGPHSSSDDPTRYRTEGEEEAWRRKNPVLAFAALLAEKGVLDAVGRCRIEREVELEVSTAADRASKIGPPELASLFDDVHAELPWNLLEQRAELEGLCSAHDSGNPLRP